jgi:ribosomal protein L40E
MAKFEEAMARNYSGKFVCRKCKSVVKGDPLKVIAGKIKCRRCHSKKLRSPRKR